MKVDGKPVVLTRHAIRRIKEMGVHRCEVELALSAPESVAESGKYPGCRNYRRGRVNVAVDEAGDDVVVITVLWPSHELWNKHIQETGGHGRTLKPWLNL